MKGKEGSKGGKKKIKSRLTAKLRKEQFHLKKKDFRKLRLANSDPETETLEIEHIIC